MSSFWGVGDKISLDQTEVEISAENGLEFTEHNVIGLYIPPQIKYFSGQESRLSFDIKLKYDPAWLHSSKITAGMGGSTLSTTRLCLDGQIGAQSLFTNVKCYAGNRATLIEETDEYNTMVSVKYSYEANDSIRHKRALTEGSSQWTAETRGTLGTLKSHQSDNITSPFMKMRNKDAVATTNDTTLSSDSDFLTAHIEMPLHMGIWANNTKAYPNVLTDGCYVELTCAPNISVFRTLDTTNKNRSVKNCPKFHGVDAAGTNWTSGKKSSDIWLTTDNMQINPQHCPFTVGEEIGIINADTGYLYNDDLATKISDPLIIQEINFTSPYTILKFYNGDGNPNNAGLGISGGDNNFVYSKALDPVRPNTNDWKPTYTLSNVKMLVHRVDVGDAYESQMMSRMKQGGVIEFDLPAVQCHKYSQLSTDTQATINISIDHAKAKSIICVPTSADTVSTKQNANSQSPHTYNWGGDDDAYVNSGTNSDRWGLSGCGNNLTDYSFQLNGIVTPSRPVKCSKSSSKDNGIDGAQILELEKAIVGAGWEPLSFADYRKNFCIGRVLAMDKNTVYNGVGVDTRLLLRYNGSAPNVNTLWKNYVFHIKTIQIKSDDITILH